MTDRFKFRAWHPINKIMHGHKDHNILAKNLCNDDGDPWIFMQCTGLKDINGNDIYEGDILLSEDILAVVEWGDEDATYELMGGYEMYGCGRMLIMGNIHKNPDMILTAKI